MYEKIYSPFGHFICHCTGNESSDAIFKTLWDTATHFAVVNSNVSKIVSVDESMRKKTRFKRAFDAFPILKKLMCDIAWAQEWPGTQTFKPDRLLVFGKTSMSAFNDFFQYSDNLFWHGADSWDDLMLFVDNKLLFYCCTHEKFASIMGNEALFLKLGLSQYVHCKENQWVIRAHDLHRDIVKTILTL